MQTIQTERLILRKWRLSDSEDHYEYARSPLVGPRAGWRPLKSEAECLEYLARAIEEDDTWAIELAGNSKVVGGLGLHLRIPDESRSDLQQREIGYVLHPDNWGQGLIPEAVTAVIKFAFEEMAIDLLWCGHFEDNHQSKRVNEKVGFQYEFSKEREIEIPERKTVKQLYYSITADQYRKHLDDRTW